MTVNLKVITVPDNMKLQAENSKALKLEKPDCDTMEEDSFKATVFSGSTWRTTTSSLIYNDITKPAKNRKKKKKIKESSIYIWGLKKARRTRWFTAWQQMAYLNFLNFLYCEVKKGKNSMRHWSAYIQFIFDKCVV